MPELDDLSQCDLTYVAKGALVARSNKSSLSGETQTMTRLDMKAFSDDAPDVDKTLSSMLSKEFCD